MTLQEALDMADAMKPNMMPRPVKIKFLNDVEQLIHGEVIMKHAHTTAEETRPEYDDSTDPGTELLIGSPYDMVYVYFIMHKIDLVNQEMDKFNNDRALYEHAWQEMADWINRTRMPLQIAREVMI